MAREWEEKCEVDLEAKTAELERVREAREVRPLRPELPLLPAAHVCGREYACARASMAAWRAAGSGAAAKIGGAQAARARGRGRTQSARRPSHAPPCACSCTHPLHCPRRRARPLQAEEERLRELAQLRAQEDQRNAQAALVIQAAFRSHMQRAQAARKAASSKKKGGKKGKGKGKKGGKKGKKGK